MMTAFTRPIVGLARGTTGADATAARPSSVAVSDTTKKLLALTEELNTLRREQAKLQQAVFEAAQVQRRLCAPRELTWGEFEVAGEIFPVRHLSGDFFKVMELEPVLGLAVGDIAGKGFTAGIWQAHLMGILQHAAQKHADPAEALAEVNCELCSAHDEPPLTALFFGRIDPKTNELSYCNAGLPAPLLMRGEDVIRRLDVGGPMLGAVKSGQFQTETIVLDGGDMLIVYSDGVTECRNSADDEFESQRLAAAASVVSGGKAPKALFSLLGTVLDFAGSCSPSDDMTLMVVRRQPSSQKGEERSSTRVLTVPRRRPVRSQKRNKAAREDVIPNS